MPGRKGNFTWTSDDATESPGMPKRRPAPRAPRGALRQRCEENDIPLTILGQLAAADLLREMLGLWAQLSPSTPYPSWLINAYVSFNRMILLSLRGVCASSSQSWFLSPCVCGQSGWSDGNRWPWKRYPWNMRRREWQAMKISTEMNWRTDCGSAAQVVATKAPQTFSIFCFFLPALGSQNVRGWLNY